MPYTTTMEKEVPDLTVLYSPEERQAFYKCWITLQHMANKVPAFWMDVLPIISTLALAYMEGYAPSISDISNTLGTPRTSTLRRIWKLRDAGLVVLKTDERDQGTRVVVTERGYREWATYLNQLYVAFHGKSALSICTREQEAA